MGAAGWDPLLPRTLCPLLPTASFTPSPSLPFLRSPLTWSRSPFLGCATHSPAPSFTEHTDTSARSFPRLGPLSAGQPGSGPDSAAAPCSAALTERDAQHSLARGERTVLTQQPSFLEAGKKVTGCLGWTEALLGVEDAKHSEPGRLACAS